MLSEVFAISFFLCFTESFSAEQFSNFNYRVKSCPSKNWYSCTFRRERICTSGGSTKFPCSKGVFYEEFNNCSYYELSKDFCDGGYVYDRFMQFCESQCSNRHEEIRFKCKSNPLCSKITHKRCSCRGKLGAWCQWSSYSQCSATCDGGVKSKVRYNCRDPINGIISSDCGSKSFKETHQTDCNTLPCQFIPGPFLTTPKTATTTTTTTRKLRTSAITERSLGPTCSSVCDGALTNDLDIRKPCSKVLKCDSNENVILSCGKSPTCSRHASSVCPIYRRWTTWSQWNAFSSNQLRYRYQACHHPTSANQYPCQKEAVLQTQCQSIGPSPINTQQWIIWLVIGLVAVVVLLCCFGILCYYFGKKQRRNKQLAAKEQNQATAGPDDVFLQSNATQVSDSASSNKLGILNRLERISEHVYEAISGQSSRLLSRLSTTSESRRSTENGIFRSSTKGQIQHDKCENEYTGDNVSFRIHDRTDRLQQSEYDVAQQSRVSVLVTDPNGLRIFEDSSQKSSSQNFLSTAIVNPIDYVEMNKDSQSERSFGKLSTSSATHEKTQWERIPSPPSHESPKPRFFKEVGNGKDTTSADKNPRRLDLSTSQATVTTSVDIDNDWPSAPMSAVDNVSMWSESSFESANYSDWENNDQSSADKISFRSKNSNSRKSLDSKYLDDKPENTSKNPGYLAPGNVSIVRYLSPRPGNPVKHRMKTSYAEDKQPDQETLGTYLKMSHDRATVKSWLNLRTAPVPQNDDVETDSYSDPNELNGRRFRELKKLSREQSLDEKYTSPASIANVTMHQAIPNDASIDTEGYFNVSYPE